jgi:phosphoglucomutase
MATSDSSSHRPIMELAQEWLRIDQDRHTNEEMQKLVDENNVEELEKRLRKRIAFGTAGLRGKMEAGYSGMNCVTVIQATQGLAAYILEQIPSARHMGVVIGYDARHNSKKFSKLAAAAFVAKNIKVWWCEVPVATPTLPFAVNELRCAAGLMITASHNPAQDNGYKVYWQNACQIIPPHDTLISEHILKNLEIVSWDKHVIDNSLLVEGAYGLVSEKYLTAVKVASDPYDFLSKSNVDLSHMNFSYTAMHGVGLSFMSQAMAALGLLKYMKVVQEQAHPDPDFPGLPFPNPEEKGALDVAKWSADRNETKLILATDPDADRLAVVEKVNGEWKQFSGNQLGILIASYVLSTYTGDLKKLAMIASTVSSRMLAVMAEKEGFHFEETLTGFKWMGNKALDLDAQGYDTRFAFEESIGYMIPGVVKDKDGVAAAGTFLTAVARWKHEKNITPWQKLQLLYKKYGYFAEANTYFTSSSPELTKKVFDNIRGLGNPYPKSLGSRKVTSWRDLTYGWDSSTEDRKPLLPVDATSQMLTCDLEGGVRMTVRASGTEPKIKIYIESRMGSEEGARRSADEVLKDVITNWLRPEIYGLKGSVGS